MSAHWLLAVGFAGMAVAIFFLGWSARIMRVEWRDDRALRAAEARYERHSHRKGDLPIGLTALPRSGRLPLERLADPEPLPGEPPWLFAGESEQGWASESAEYELLHRSVAAEHICDPGPRSIGLFGIDCPACHAIRQHELLHKTAALPASPVEGEPPIDTGELLAITDRVESWIAQWTAQGNVDRHTIQAGDS